METEIINLLSLGVIGTLITWLVDYLKTISYLKGVRTKVVVAALSVVLGSVFALARDTEWWATAVVILMASQTVYGFFVKK